MGTYTEAGVLLADVKKGNSSRYNVKYNSIKGNAHKQSKYQNRMKGNIYNQTANIRI
jgi:hypothetical protein